MLKLKTIGEFAKRLDVPVLVSKRGKLWDIVTCVLALCIVMQQRRTRVHAERYSPSQAGRLEVKFAITLFRDKSKIVYI